MILTKEDKQFLENMEILKSQGLLKENSNRENPMKLLEELAPVDPINLNEGGCVFCGQPRGVHGYGFATKNPRDHREDCPWVRARRLLEGVKHGN